MAFDRLAMQQFTVSGKALIAFSPEYACRSFLRRDFLLVAARPAADDVSHEENYSISWFDNPAKEANLCGKND